MRSLINDFEDLLTILNFIKTRMRLSYLYLPADMKFDGF